MGIELVPRTPRHALGPLRYILICSLDEYLSYLTEEKRNWFEPVLGFLRGSKTLTDNVNEKWNGQTCVTCDVDIFSSGPGAAGPCCWCDSFETSYDAPNSTHQIRNSMENKKRKMIDSQPYNRNVCGFYVLCTMYRYNRSGV